jgi:hypothetical protein
MRTISVNHRDGRGRVEYCVFETVESLLERKPNANATNNLANAIEGDYVVSDNGWVVPLIRKTYLEDKYCRGGKKRYKRNKVYRYVVFHFPKDRKVWRAENLHNVKFNYTPKTGKNIASDEKRNRMYELSARKIYWAQLVASGVEMEEAVRIAYPRVVNKNKLLKQLLLNDKIMGYMAECRGISTRQAFERANLNYEYLARTLMATLDDDTADTKLKIYAMDVILKLLMKMSGY